MLTLERWRRKSIYSLGGRRGTRASALTVRRQGWPDVWATGRMSGASGEAGCPGWGRMSGASGEAGCPGWGPDVRAGGQNFWMFCSVAPDVRAFGRMSGLDTGCPGPVGLGVWAAAAVDAPGAGCPGSWPDVRGLEGELARFRWFSSSMDLAACPSSCTSPGGSS